MHRLVHAWGQDRLFDEPEEKKFCLATFFLLAEAAIECSEDPRDKLRLVPHVMSNFAAVKGIALRPGGDMTMILNSLGLIARFVYSVGQWGNTLSIERFLLEERVRIYGNNHPETLSAMNNLAATLGDQGKLLEAAAMKTEVLSKKATDPRRTTSSQDTLRCAT